MTNREKYAIRLLLWVIIFLLSDSEDRDRLKAISTSMAVNKFEENN